MIKNISFSNFYSFYEETTISLELGQKPSKSLYDINYNDERINKNNFSKIFGKKNDERI